MNAISVHLDATLSATWESDVMCRVGASAAGGFAYSTSDMQQAVSVMVGAHLRREVNEKQGEPVTDAMSEVCARVDVEFPKAPHYVHKLQCIKVIHVCLHSPSELRHHTAVQHDDRPPSTSCMLQCACMTVRAGHSEPARKQVILQCCAAEPFG